MAGKYSGLKQLIEQDQEAKRYYESLPGYVQEAVFQREDGVNSFESLRHYVDNLTEGDD